MPEISSVRLDKWLWAARVFKTRSLATDACRQGRVTIAGQAKPARDVRVNDIIVVAREGLSLRFKVLQLLEQRVGAALVPGFAENLTPPEEYEKARQARASAFGFRPKGTGRPAKKERRQWDRIVAEE